MTRIPRLQWRFALVAALSLATGGCIGLSFPLGEPGAGAPAITGAISPASWLPQPLPAGLAPSDADSIAEAARRALAAQDPQAIAEWQNPATGSRGTLAATGNMAEETGETCRTYLSTVTSIKGVHRYACKACRAADGRVTVRSIEPASIETVRSAGI